MTFIKNNLVYIIAAIAIGTGAYFLHEGMTGEDTAAPPSTIDNVTVTPVE